MLFLNNLDLHQNEIQNFRVQNLAVAPENPVKGQHYFNTVDNTEYVYDGTKWIDALSQGDYTFTNGIVEGEGRTVSLLAATRDSIGGVIIGTNIDVDGGTISVKDATNAQKGLIQIATDAEAEAGTNETKAINAKQLDTKVTKNANITGATKTKITYDEKGLVTAGADLSEADIPNLHLAKVTDVTATAAEVNVLDGIEVTTAELNALDNIASNVQEQLDAKVAKNDDITAGTHTKITYDAKGLVTGGADLSQADIPALNLTKISDVTATAAEVNELAGAGTVKADFEKLHAITATASQINAIAEVDAEDLEKLHDITATADEINILDGATITTTELNALDNITGNVQEQLDDKVEKNADITAGTKTKITYDAKGLVTAGADLSEADIPSLHLAKITDVTATAAEVNVLDGIEVTTAELNALDNIASNVQEQLDDKVAKNEAITGATKTKITYDAKGLVTGGADLSEADIPNLGAAKITNLTGYAKATEVADLAATDTALEAFGKIQASLDNKIALTALSIDSESTDYLTYDSANGKFGAKVTDSATQSSTDLITAGGVFDAVKDKIELDDISIAAASTDYAEYDNTKGEIGIKAGVANGLATLDANGLVPSTQLPSYVDDVIELLSITTEPATASAGDKYYNSTTKKILTYSGSAWGDAQDPETGKIYVCNDMAYRWSGSALVQIGADKLLGFNGTIEGDGTTTTFTVNHALGTRNVVFEIYDATTYEKVYVQVVHSTANALQVIFAQAPTVGENYVITVIAIG